MTYPKLSLLASALVIFLFTLVGGCSEALILRLSTDTFRGTETEPFVTEHPIGVRDHFGYQKRLIISNPKFTAIEAEIKCSSMFMDDPVAMVPARTDRFLLISGTRELEQTCFLTNWTPIRP